MGEWKRKKREGSKALIVLHIVTFGKSVNMWILSVWWHKTTELKIGRYFFEIIHLIKKNNRKRKHVRSINNGHRWIEFEKIKVYAGK